MFIYQKNIRFTMSFFKKTALAATAFLFLTAALFSPVSALTTSEEKELAEEFLEAVHKHYNVIDDPVINNYINDLGERLTRGVSHHPFGFTFHVIREGTFNAFAGPGGNIFVFSGLIEALETENELAAIIAHEIAHVSGRHVQDMVERSKRTGLTSMAGVIAGILVGLGGAPTAGAAISVGSAAAGQTMMLAYSRESELQADFFGRRYLVDAGYHEYGMLSALKRIRSREWYGKDEVPTYLRTHPAAGERMAMLGSIMPEEPPELKNSHEYDRTRMRVMALHGRRDNAIDRLSRMARDNPENAAVHYGLGLALAEGGNPEKGISHLEKALRLDPDDPHISVSLGRAHFLAGDNRQAINILNRIGKIEQYGHEGMISLGRAQMAEGETTSAIDTFRKLLDHYPNHKQGLFYLGRSMGEQGDLGEAHYYLGRFHREQGNLDNAGFHFNRALSETRDPEKKTEIEKRIRELDPARKKQRQQER